MHHPQPIPPRPAPGDFNARLAAAQARLMAAERAKLARQRQFIQ